MEDEAPPQMDNELLLRYIQQLVEDQLADYGDGTEDEFVLPEGQEDYEGPEGQMLPPGVQDLIDLMLELGLATLYPNPAVCPQYSNWCIHPEDPIIRFTSGFGSPAMLDLEPCMN